MTNRPETTAGAETTAHSATSEDGVTTVHQCAGATTDRRCVVMMTGLQCVMIDPQCVAMMIVPRCAATTGRRAVETTLRVATTAAGGDVVVMTRRVGRRSGRSERRRRGNRRTRRGGLMTTAGRRSTSGPRPSPRPVQIALCCALHTYMTAADAFLSMITSIYRSVAR